MISFVTINHYALHPVMQRILCLLHLYVCPRLFASWEQRVYSVSHSCIHRYDDVTSTMLLPVTGRIISHNFRHTFALFWKHFNRGTIISFDLPFGSQLIIQFFRQVVIGEPSVKTARSITWTMTANTFIISWVLYDKLFCAEWKLSSSLDLFRLQSLRLLSSVSTQFFKL